MHQAAFLALFLVTAIPMARQSMADCTKTQSVLFPRSMREKAIANARNHPWAAEIRDAIVEAARPWMGMSDDELWDLMFGPTIKRSWMVWSNGFCPACKKDVPMYEWKMDALGRPWKTQCPECGEIFPKNDFHKFYLSGLDEHGVFDPAKADRSLLYNTDHPDPKDPLHLFGVDDGEGCVEGDHRWRFIGAYLIYGQWKQAIVAGIRSLGAAYTVTGDPAFAHKAAVMLDRVADLYPSHDFGKQGVMYEGPPARGYVSTWHDACWETQDMTLAYDQIFDAIKEDAGLAQFLARKAKRYHLQNPKLSFADIQRNIEGNIVQHAIDNRARIESNFPQTDFAIIFAKTVLGWPGNRDEVMGLIGGIVDRTTAVDGLTGEKGLTGYSSLGPVSLGFLLERFSAVSPTFLRDMLEQHPKIHDCYRFHLDTWCLNGTYYPLSGDCGAYAHRVTGYPALRFDVPARGGRISIVPALTPSMFSFLWNLYGVTKDPAFVQLLYKANGGSLDGLPHDLFAENPAAFQTAVRKVIDEYGADIKIGSVNKQQWHLGILRSGEGDNQRALWLDYDAGGGHSHWDGMNLGLFAYGLDLLPDFGYPPVQFGGWGSPRANWYTRTAAHNTVEVDGVNHSKADGKTTLWADGKQFHAIRASGPEIIKGKQFERTAALVDVDENRFYVLDVFRVEGGKEHARFVHSHFGSITTAGLKLSPTADFTQGTQMRDFMIDLKPEVGWSVDWLIEDKYKLLPAGTQVHFRCTDLTTGAQAVTAEQWVSTSQYEGTKDAWIPAVIVRRQASEPELASTFVSVMEPYTSRPAVDGIRRLPLTRSDGAASGDTNVALEMKLSDGRMDVFIAAEEDLLAENTNKISLDGEMCLVRFGRDGKIMRVALAKARAIKIGSTSIRLKSPHEYVEVEFGKNGPVVVAGPTDAIDTVDCGKQ
jgi:hypothetical protein